MVKLAKQARNTKRIKNQTLVYELEGQYTPALFKSGEFVKIYDTLNVVSDGEIIVQYSNQGQIITVKGNQDFWLVCQFLTYNNLKFVDLVQVIPQGYDFQLTRTGWSVDVSLIKELYFEDQRLSEMVQQARQFSVLAINQEQGDDITKTIRCLSLNAIPDEMLGRESEVDQLKDFILSGLESSGSRFSMYLCGMPGSGKTACVNFLHNQLRSQFEYEFYSLNCMKLSNPNEVYQELYQKVSGLWRQYTTARKQLQSILFKPPVRLILIDEIDGLITRRQEILYNLFDWASNGAKIILICISNTMDLNERLLRKVTSRCGNTRIVFRPYTRQDLENILNKRVQMFNVFSQDSIKLCSARVAGASGDTRRALQICKRAAIIAQNSQASNVTPSHITQAYKQLLGSHFAIALPKFPRYMKVYLLSLCMALKVNQTNVIDKELVAERFQTNLQTVLGESEIGWLEVQHLCYRLAGLEVITIDKQNLSLAVCVDEILYALNEDEVFSKFKDNL